jgi:hypothetical protein
MASRRTRQRILRSPIQPGIGWKGLLPLIPIAIILAGFVGTWYVQKDRQERMEHDLDQLAHDVQVLQLSAAGEVGNQAMLSKVRDDVEQIARDVVKLKTRAGIN